MPENQIQNNGATRPLITIEEDFKKLQLIFTDALTDVTEKSFEYEFKEIELPKDYKQKVNFNDLNMIVTDNYHQIKSGKYEQYIEDIKRDIDILLKSTNKKLKEDLLKAIYIVKQKDVQAQVSFIHNLVSGGNRKWIAKSGIDTQLGRDIEIAANQAISDIIYQRTKIDDITAEEVINDMLLELRQGILDEYFSRKYNTDNNRILYEKFVACCSELALGVPNRYNQLKYNEKFDIYQMMKEFSTLIGLSNRHDELKYNEKFDRYQRLEELNKDEILKEFNKKYTPSAIIKAISEKAGEIYKSAYNSDYINSNKKRSLKYADVLTNYIVKEVFQENIPSFDVHTKICGQDPNSTEFDYNKIKVNPEVLKEMLIKMGKIKTIKDLKEINVIKEIREGNVSPAKIYKNKTLIKKYFGDIDIHTQMLLTNNLFKESTYKNMKLLESFWENNEYDLAITAGQQIKDENNQARVLEQIATKAIEKRGYSSAITAVEKIRNKSARIRVLTEVATKLIEKGEYHLPITAAEKIDSMYDQAIVLKEIATTLAQRGEYTLAITTAEKINVEYFEYVQVRALQQIAATLAQRGEYNLAITIAEKINVEYNEHDIALNEIADTLAQRGEYNLAIATAEKIKDGAKNVRVLQQIVAKAIEQTGYNSAMTAAKEVKNKYSRDSVLDEISDTMIKKGEYDLAMTAAKEVRNKYSRDSVLGKIADTMIKKGEYDSAIETAKKIKDSFSLNIRLNTISKDVYSKYLNNNLDLEQTYNVMQEVVKVAKKNNYGNYTELIKDTFKIFKIIEDKFKQAEIRKNPRPFIPKGNLSTNTEKERNILGMSSRM